MVLKTLSCIVILSGLTTPTNLGRQQTTAPEASTASQAKDDTAWFHWDFADLAGAFGIVFGIVTLIAYLDQRRSMKEQADVMKYIKRNMTKDVTDETIAKLSEQLKLMQKQTKEEIPRLARTAVLNEQAERIKTVMSEMYLQWKSIQLEIHGTGTIALDEDLESAIADRMLPAYVRRQKAEAGRDRLAVLGAGTAVAGILLPFPASRVVESVLGAALMLTILQLMFAAAVNPRQQRNIRVLVSVLLALGAVTSGGFAYFLLKADGVTEAGHVLGSILAATFVGLVTGSYFIDRWVWRWLQRRQITAI